MPNSLTATLVSLCLLTASTARAKDCSERATAFKQSTADLKQTITLEIPPSFRVPDSKRGEGLVQRAPIVMFQGSSVFVDGVLAISGDVVATLRDTNPKSKVAYLAVTSVDTLARLREGIGKDAGAIEWRLLVQDPDGGFQASEIASQLFRLAEKCPGVAKAFQRAAGEVPEKKWDVVRNGLISTLKDCTCKVDTKELVRIVRSIMDAEEQPVKWRRVRLELEDAGLGLRPDVSVAAWLQADDAK